MSRGCWLVLFVVAGCRWHFEDTAGDATSVSADTIAPAQCPAGYTTQPGLTSRYRVALGHMTWFEAYLDCRNDDTHLIVINDATENAFASSVIASLDEHVWIGGGDWMAEGDYRWLTGPPLQAFTAWHQNEPNDDQGLEDYIELDTYTMWNDARNAPGFGTFHHICECDGLGALPACNTDRDSDCGRCGVTCLSPQICVNQMCN